ncbi:MAG: tetratricopeptide repeat protein [Acidobacteriia bacterium]|nr:tetratricopeptide repeat protein [Terriglobia bacterium]
MKALLIIATLLLASMAIFCQSSTSLVARGKQQINAHQYKTAVATLQQAVRIDPNNVEAYHLLGEAYSKLNMFSEAAQAYEKSAQILTSGPAQNTAPAKTTARTSTTPHRAAPTPTTAAARNGGGGSGAVALGNYQCWSWSQPRPFLNFTILNGSQYTGSDGKTGNYVYEGGSGRITFTSGFLKDAMPPGFRSVYHLPEGRPKVSFYGPSNSEASYCENK